MIEEITSRRALRQAFGRVRDNGGCRGADGVSLGEFEANLETELDRLEGSLLRRCYRPFPLLRFPVPKRSGGERFLAVPTVRDRVIQTAVYDATRPVFEAELEDVSHAFRVGRSVRSAIHQIDQLRSEGYGWIVDADIDGFFDAIPRRRRTRLAHALKDFGQRVQYSVFECRLTEDQVGHLRESVLREIETEEDRVRVYRFCADCGAKTELFGLGTLTEDPEVYIL